MVGFENRVKSSWNLYVENLSVRLSLILGRNKKVEHNIRIKTCSHRTKIYLYSLRVHCLVRSPPFRPRCLHMCVSKYFYKL